MVIIDMEVKTFSEFLSVFLSLELCKVKQSQPRKQVAGQVPNVLGGSRLQNVFLISL